ncbi:ABC transporter permease [Phycicoccus endophyticus]|uniref:ABC transporter permease n=1 Tax=Phycicoccus endophyticus TaxID=1690220 RepID=A0A7G9R1H2_9MICO|nr:ABC transporter permease [Phycicoccus endophyticus]NHI18765.1 ABC transporter permease [Phycicoccus endophyticus]QNN49447.1 ABC transporter permease [Phycicoccus endophyticus]GGL36719.1 glycine/betaine ABC transporter permease [Phycicoccus endophyticus]
MIASLLSWFTDAETWAGESGIGNRLLEHLWYTLATMVVAMVLAVPAGLWVGHTGHARWLVTVANSLRAVPTLGLLLAASLWLRTLPGDLAYVVPSIAVLALLAIPPVLAGTYGGIEAVDPAARDAAYGVGMRGRQVLWQVEVPNALPLILSGVRSAVLQVVATATIAAIVGLGGLGRFIIDGLALSDYAQAGGGALLVAVLALALEGLLALVQRRLVSPGLSGRPVGGSRKDDEDAPREEPGESTVDLRTPA